MAEETSTTAKQVMHEHPRDMELTGSTVNLVQDTISNANAPGSIGSPQATSPPTRSRFRVVAIVTALFLALFVSALDATIVSTAAPTMSNELHSAAGYTWIGGAYLLANMATGPIVAKLSDIWGRKIIMLVALAEFFASSTVCATANSMSALIIGRAFQGAAGGGLIMLVHVCISDLFSLRQRSLLLGLTEGIWALAGGVGPVLGGVFASTISWRWCFYINLPLVGTAFLLVLFFLDIRHEHTSFMDGVKAMDWSGMFTFIGFSLMLLLGLDFGGALFPWESAKVIALLVVGVLMAVGFVYSEARIAQHPLIPMGLFRQKTNVASLAVVFFHGITFVSAEYYLPLFLQAVLGMTPLLSGVILLPFIVTGACAGITCGVIIHRTGRFRELMWVGTALLCLGFGLFVSWGADTKTATVVGFMLIGGAGSGLLFEPPLIAIQSQVQQSDVATATATMSFVRNFALTLSIVIGGTILQNSMDNRVSFLRDAGLPADLLSRLSGTSAAANVDLVRTISNPAWRLAAREAFAWSIRNMWITYTAFAALGVVASAFVGTGHLSTEHVETVTGLKRNKPAPQRGEEMELTTRP